MIEAQTDSPVYLYSKAEGVGVSNITASNQLISPLIFNGYGFGLFKSIFKEKENTSWYYNSNVSYGYLSNNNNIYGISNVNFEKNISYLFSIYGHGADRFQLKAGIAGIGFLEFLYKNGNTNNPFTYVCHFSAGLGLHGKYSLNVLNWNVFINNYFCFPVLGVLSSSGYAESQPDFTSKYYSFKASSFSNNRTFYNNYYIDFKHKIGGLENRFSWRLGICSQISFQPNSNYNRLVSNTFYLGRIVNIYSW